MMALDQGLRISNLSGSDSKAKAVSEFLATLVAKAGSARLSTLSQTPLEPRRATP